MTSWNNRVLSLFMLITIFSSLQILAVSTSGTEQSPSQVYDISHTNTGAILDQEDPLCLVPCDEIVNGGPGKDGIPSIDDPQYYSVDVANFEEDLSNSDVIMGVEIDGVMYGYPHNILNWHEIVNHQVQDAILSITYCPLTGTGIPYQHNSELGVSGQLFENNLVFYDRNSNSYWSQMYGLSIQGDRIGETLDQGNMVEMRWSAFSAMYPDALILTRDTGHIRSYDSYPYARLDYLNSDAIIFPTAYDPEVEPYSLYHTKELTVVLSINGLTALLPFEELAINGFMTITHNEVEVVTFYDQSGRIATPFLNELNGEVLQFMKLSGDQYDESKSFSLNVYSDQFGNIWNQKGEVIEGPDLGAELLQLAAYNAFWFAATAFFPDAILYTADDSLVLDGDNALGTYSDLRSADFNGWLVSVAIVPLLIRRRR